MSTNGGPDHDEILGRLQLLARGLDPVPRRVVEAAKASATWQTVDVELADLIYDSVVDEALVGVRGGTARQLTFKTADITVEVEVAADSRRINGQLVPPQEADVEIRYPDGSVAVQSDRLGHFRADGVPAGPVSLRCRIGGPTGRAAHTDWVVL